MIDERILEIMKILSFRDEGFMMARKGMIKQKRVYGNEPVSTIKA